jgi:predicted CoA-substrate-specific enzyme activase
MRVRYVGIDAGTLFVKFTILQDGRPPQSFIVCHHGDPARSVLEFAAHEASNGGSDAVFQITGIHARSIATSAGVKPLDGIRALVAGVNSVAPGTRNVFDIGGGSLTLITLGADGSVEGFTQNGLCAAGTGSFLDEQAARLAVSYDETASFSAIENPPPIATRCAVFAKSDITHRQQEGYSKPEMWSGLCKGLSHTIIQTLCRGRRLEGQTVVAGGVSRNSEVVKWLSREIAGARAVENGHSLQSLGVALIARAEGGAPIRLLAGLDSAAETGSEGLARRSALTLSRSKFPSFDVEEQYDDDQGNEIRVVAWPGRVRAAGSVIDVYIGVDVGSTSTKLAIVAPDGTVLANVYRRTLGDPVGAVKRLFGAVLELARRRGTELFVKGAATTGSGRQIAGAVIGADVVVNEISAHARGASEALPDVETIFEIGGQDSKYIRLQNGLIADANMNYICAAGTGSFVEEVGRKMGWGVREIGDRALGVAPPVTSDRCTVFMEQDVHALLRRGASREEAMAAVVCSVVQNYLNKVVGRRPVSKERVVFQGATARNKALVAAIEQLLGVEVVVSPYCHVMGAYGAALIARDRVNAERGKTTFAGLDLASREVTMERSECALCQNRCEIITASIEGASERPSWGYMCGREPGAGAERRDEGFRPLETRDTLWRGLHPSSFVLHPSASRLPSVGLPRALSTWMYFPLWKTFLSAVGLRPVLGPRNTEEVREAGARAVPSDYCFPVKVAHGQIGTLFDRMRCDFVLAPDMIGAEENRKTTNSLFCPYVETLGSVAKNGRSESERVLAPLIDMRWKEEVILDEIEKTFGPVTGLSRGAIKAAWRRAIAAQAEFRRSMEDEGRKILAELERTGGQGIVLLGRAYNTVDLDLNLSLPRKLARFGLTVIPSDMLPLRPDAFEGTFSNMYWATGQTILSAARTVASHPNLHGIYFSNFKCGPDSFILSFVEKIMGDKPMLVLELDEHGADAGYATRIEAFLDVLCGNGDRKVAPKAIVRDSTADEVRKKKVWIPPMHPVAPRLFAAAFRGDGWSAGALSPEDTDAHLLGRSLVRGGECLPTSLTIGAFVKKMREPGVDPAQHALFMPRAIGPCRFGQYSALHRIVLDRLGMKDTPILSPSSYNTYMGLDGDLRRRLWHAVVLSDVLFKCRCRVKPYESNPGETDAVIARAMDALEKVLEEHGDPMPVLEDIVAELWRIPRRGGQKPIVGIVGEIYIRCNTFANQDVVGAVEACGGEAWLAPLGEWISYTAFMEDFNFRSGKYTFDLFKWGKNAITNRVMLREEEAFVRAAAVIGDRAEPPVESSVKEGAKYVPIEFEGETILTLGRAIEFMKHGASLVVNCSPFGCMPGTITTGLFPAITHEYGVPVVNMFYDGEGDLNWQVATALANIKPRPPRPRHPPGRGEGVSRLPTVRVR